MKASLLKSWIVAVPLAAVLIAMTTALIPSAEPLTVLAYTAYFAQLVAAQTAFALGLFLLVRVPSDNQKDKNMTLFVVFQVILFVSIGMFIASAQIVGGAGGLLFVHAPATWVVAVTVLLLGMGKLRRIE